MAAPFDVYVDLTDGTASGSGTSGDPYGTLQYALDQRTSGGNGGTGHWFNCYGSGLIGADLSLTTYSAPTNAAPLGIRGITTTPGDGGIGTIDGQGLYLFMSSTNAQFVVFDHLRITNVTGVYVPSFSCIQNCEIDDITATLSANGVVYAVYLPYAGSALNNYVHNCTGAGLLLVDSMGSCSGNRVIDGAKKFTTAGIYTLNNFSGNVLRNTVAVSGSCDGIVVNHSSSVTQNSVYSAGGTGAGVRTHITSQTNCHMSNNLIEGFSGAGGQGLVAPSAGYASYVDGNGVYNCTTAFANLDRAMAGKSNNLTLTASPFRNAASGDFRILDASGNPVNSEIVGMGRPGKVGLY